MRAVVRAALRPRQRSQRSHDTDNTSQHDESITAIIAAHSSPASRAPPTSQQQLDAAISSFELELKGSPEDAARFMTLRSLGSPTPNDVFHAVEAIVGKCTGKARRGRPMALGLTTFLERVQQFAPVGDVLVGGAQNMIASGVWAAIRLALEVSMGFFAFFDKISTMLLRLSKSTVVGQEFATLFPGNEELQSYSIDYMRLVVVLSTQVVRFVQRSTLRQLSDALLSSYEATFPPLESRMRDTCELIRAKVSLLAAQENQRNHSLTHRFLTTANALQYNTSRELARMRQMKTEADGLRALLSLSPAQALFDRHYRRHRAKGHSAWLFEHEKYKLWLDAPAPAVFWLRGTLGSGKSVIAASVAAHLLSNGCRPISSDSTTSDPRNSIEASKFSALTNSRHEPRSVCHCFADERDPASLSASTVLGSIAYQVLRDVVSHGRWSDELFSLVKRENEELMPQEYVDILLACMPQDWSAVIVLDGMDNCQPKEFQSILVQLLRLGNEREIHIFCSARISDASFPASSLGSEVLYRVDIDRVDRSTEVSQYIMDRLRHWAEDDLFSAELARAIVEKLQLGFAGMFLWLSLQMEAIAEDLEAGVPVRDILLHLPPDLEQVYAAAARRIPDRPGALKIMKLVAAAEPPLTFDELRVAAAITPGTFDVDFSKVPKREAAFIRNLAGHLLEIDEDHKVYFVHHSAMLHITEPKSPIDQANSVPPLADFCFKIADAKELFASVVMTYLDHPALNQSLIAQKEGLPLSGDAVYSAVTSSVNQNAAETSGRLYHLIKRIPAEKQKHGLKIDINDLFSSMHERPRKPTDDLSLFRNYAKSNWVAATHYLDLNNQAFFKCFHSLIEGPREPGVLPFNADDWKDALNWTTQNGHHCLYEYCVTRAQGSRVSPDVLKLINNDKTFNVVGPALLPVLVSLLDSPWYSLHPTLTALIFRPETTNGYQLSGRMIQELAKDAPLVWRILQRTQVTSAKLCQEHVLAFMQDHGVENPVFVADYPPEHSVWPSSDEAEVVHFAPILDAARLGDTQCMEFLLRHGATLEKRDESDRTAFMLAAKRGSDDILHLLLMHGDLLDRESNGGQTALSYAVEGNQAHTARFILGRGGRLIPWTRDPSSRETVFHRAAAAGSANVLVALLEWAHPNDLDELDMHGQSALSRACRNSHWLCAEILALAGANPGPEIKDDAALRTVVAENASGRHPELFRLLFSSDGQWEMPMCPPGMSILKSACEKRQWDYVERLLKAGVDLDSITTRTRIRNLLEKSLGRESELFRLTYGFSAGGES